MTKNLKTRSSTILLFILLFGLILRIYQLNTYLYFSGDEGRDLLIIKDIIIKHEIPLLGPPTSLGWLHIGPFSYFVYALVLWMGKFHPVSIVFLNILADTVAIIFIFLMTRKMMGNRVGLAAAFLYSTSPYVIMLSRMPLHIGLYGLFACMFFYFFILYQTTYQKVYMYTCFFLLGIGIQIHLTAMLLALPLAFLVIKRKEGRRQLLLAVILFAAPLLPILVYEIQNGFGMSMRFIAWIPYRILSFFGIITQKNVITFPKLSSIFDILISAVQRMLFVSDRFIASTLFVIATLYGYFKMRGNRYFRLILTIVGFSLLALFLHGEPSWHYFGFLAPLVLLLTSYFISRRKIGFVLLFLIVVTNTNTLVRNHYFVDFPLAEQVAIIDAVLDHTKGEPYEIKPPEDIVNLPDYYKNYYYIGWWRGQIPVDSGGFNRFIIYPKSAYIPFARESAYILVFPHAVVIQSYSL